MIDWKITVAANLSEKAIDFLMTRDAMKMSMVQRGGLTEQEAEEIICEVMQETSGRYRSSGLKEKIKVNVTDVYHVGPFPGK